jgi:Protein of unknown function (DUF4065)
MRNRKPTYDEEKLRELALYLALKFHGNPTFGMVKLYKLLFFVDFDAYRDLKEPVTGAAYQRLPLGPAPKKILPLVKEMVRRKEAAVQLAALPGTGKPQERLLALRGPKLSVFTSEEVSLIDGVIQRFWDKTGHELSELSHQFPGWMLARDGQDIPYFTVHVPRKQPVLTERQERAVQAAIARHAAEGFRTH